MDKDIKLARIKSQQAEREAVIAFAKAMLSNPVVELIGGMTLIEYLLNNPKGDPILKFGASKQLALEAGVTSAVIVQQLAPSIPILAQGASDVVGSLGKLIPLLAAA